MGRGEGELELNILPPSLHGPPLRPCSCTHGLGAYTPSPNSFQIVSFFFASSAIILAMSSSDAPVGKVCTPNDARCNAETTDADERPPDEDDFLEDDDMARS